MENLSRRSLLTSTSVGVAAAGALALTRPLSAGATPTLPAVPAVPHIAALDNPVVAHVEDLATGQVVLFTGEKAVTVTDHALAQLLAHHSKK